MSARSRWSKTGGLSATVLAIAAFGASCSLERPERSKFSVRVDVPNSESSPIRSQSLTPTSLADINCIGISIRSATATGLTCHNLLHGGVTAGTSAGRPVSFDIQIIPAKGLLFEAYGFKSASCHSLGRVLDSFVPADATFNGKVYRLGQVAADITQESTSITITASFDSTLE